MNTTNYDLKPEVTEVILEYMTTNIQRGKEAVTTKEFKSVYNHGMEHNVVVLYVIYLTKSMCEYLVLIISNIRPV